MVRWKSVFPAQLTVHICSPVPCHVGCTAMASYITTHGPTTELPLLLILSGALGNYTIQRETKTDDFVIAIYVP